MAWEQCPPCRRVFRRDGLLTGGGNALVEDGVGLSDLVPMSAAHDGTIGVGKFASTGDKKIE